MSDFNPKVSIVIPVYNGANFLSEAIKSALAQTYRNIEIIVVNDGSKDNGATEEIAKSYGNKIKYYSKENGGVATALNLGIKKMTGDYMSWLSHDDLLYPDKIEKQIKFMSRQVNKNIVLYSNYALLKDGRIIPVILNHESLSRKPKYSLLRGSVNGITVLLPKSIIDEVGYFDDELRCTQDYDYWKRIQNKYDFVHMEDILSVTRIHGGQDSAVSPRVVQEGDELWIRLVDWLSDKEKIKYEFTLYNFYLEMIKFLETTPYSGAKKYCEKKIHDLSSFGAVDYKVSVIIPFYNRIDETLRSIKSALSQTYNNLEIILVNDKSTEDISAVKKIVTKNSNIKLITMKKNGGAAAARNYGIRESSGDYIAFLDSDDVFDKGKIEYQLSEMVKRNTDISYTSYIKRSGGIDVEMGGHDISGVVIPRMISSCPIATPTVMVRRKLLVENNIYFNESMRIGEDTCYWLEIAKITEILHIDKPLSIVYASNDSSAYDYDKLQIGMMNILAYLTNDSYYSSFYHDIAIFARDYANLDALIESDKSKRLEIDGHKSLRLVNAIGAVFRDTVPYRVARKIRRDGLASAYKLTLEKIISKSS